ncbi:MAG TPA: hypothetical protein PK983_11370 [Syntrophales bacterium]|nr:hypothetical protein [Syntrophales bacterium]
MIYPNNIRGIFGYGSAPEAGLPLFSQPEPPSKPANPFRHGSQNHRLYNRLAECGPMTNAEIVREMSILKYTGRLTDIRQHLEGTGWTVKSTELDGGLWRYELVRS